MRRDEQVEEMKRKMSGLQHQLKAEVTDDSLSKKITCRSAESEDAREYGYMQETTQADDTYVSHDRHGHLETLMMEAIHLHKLLSPWFRLNNDVDFGLACSTTCHFD